ncbi:MAG: single-stranded-DNA-specific exonuclease RecJ [Syntrophobacteraceae bacterium]
MGRNCRIQLFWKFVNERIPATVSEVIDMLLQNRNLDRRFIGGELKDLADHLSIRGMSDGAGLLARHMAAGSKIVLVADYDCDGITSAAQMALFLQETGYENFSVIIPSREEGYGIPERAVRENSNAGIFVAMDCGTLDITPIRLARSFGADCIVIDHHEVPNGEIAPASILINPKQAGCCSTFKEFSASGLTFLFLASLRRALDGRFPSPALGGKYLALAATGTVADLVPLISANRILTRSGLRNLNANRCAALSQLAGVAGLAGKDLTAGHISFYIGPRINAAGRVSEGRIAYDLLVSDQPQKVAGLAQELNRLNIKRQGEEESILRDIRKRFEGELRRRRTFVMADPTWPPGVVGIAASRVQQELHYAPVIILSIDEGKGIARGSARSVTGFDIHHALSRCSDLLIRWGGHKAAAGLTIEAGRIEEFSDRFEEIAQACPEELFVPSGRVDMELPLKLADSRLLEALKELEPHGMGNPAPIFGLRNASFTVAKLFGKEQKHVKLQFDNGLEGTCWQGAERFPSLVRGKKAILDLVFQVTRDGFNSRPMLEIKEMGQLFGKG